VDYRKLGTTGINLPVVGLGTWQYKGCAQPLRIGIALGARFIDTAESYGTEEVVGEAIREVRNEVFLATKLSPRNFRYSDVIESANRSLRRLRTDYIDLYQLHWPNYSVPIEETMGAMEQLVDTGKIRFIGVSNFMLADLKAVQKVMTKSRIVSNQVRYNLIDRTIEYGLLQYCQDHKITVIAHSPLATGLSNLRAGDPENVLEQLAERKSKTIAQIAIDWCLAKPGLVTIPKANSPEHVRENCAALDAPLSSEDLHLLDTRVRFRRRGRLEVGLRRLVRRALQTAGKNQ
jgi:diketogulonate reductase-like aldo/keto reductase